MTIIIGSVSFEDASPKSVLGPQKITVTKTIEFKVVFNEFLPTRIDYNQSSSIMSFNVYPAKRKMAVICISCVVLLPG